MYVVYGYNGCIEGLRVGTRILTLVTALDDALAINLKFSHTISPRKSSSRSCVIDESHEDSNMSAYPYTFERPKTTIEIDPMCGV